MSTNEPQIAKKAKIQATDEELVNVQKVDMWVDKITALQKEKYDIQFLKIFTGIKGCPVFINNGVSSSKCETNPNCQTRCVCEPDWKC